MVNFYAKVPSLGLFLAILSGETWESRAGTWPWRLQVAFKLLFVQQDTGVWRAPFGSS